MTDMVGYKLMRLRKDGSLGALFIDARQRIAVGKWMWAKDVPTKGYAHRPGWHILPEPKADHLSERDRVWCRVEFRHFKEHKRPANQGGMWYLARRMRVVEVLADTSQPSPTWREKANNQPGQDGEEER